MCSLDHETIPDVENDTLAVLVERALKGDKSAFSELVERNWFRLVRLARSMVGTAEAEDVVQDGLLAAWKDLPSLRHPEAFSSWVTRIVYRRCLRRKGKLNLLQAGPEPAERDSGASPESGCDVDTILSMLAPRQRAVMHLTIVEGMSDSEIAALLGIRASSVRSHRRRAREHLGKILKKTR